MKLGILGFITIFLVLLPYNALAFINSSSITTLSDGFSSKILEYNSARNNVVYIDAYKNVNVSSARIGLIGTPIQVQEGVSAGNLTNGNFEYNFSDWKLLGDPNDCASDTICPTTWCDLTDPSCKVKSMFVNITNDTIFGNFSAFLGHYSKDSYTYLHSKIDLRQNISLPTDVAVLSLSTKMFSQNSNQKVYTYSILVDNGTENVLWYMKDTNSSLKSFNTWTFLNFSLSDYAGQNVTLIFRFMQDFCCGNGRQWDVVWSGTSLWYLDNIKTYFSNSTYSNSYPASVSLDLGNDGTIEWSNSGIFNESLNISNISNYLTNYLKSCTVDITSNKCLFPLAFHSGSSGLINISDVQIQLSDFANPIIENVSFEPKLHMHNGTQIIDIYVTDNSQIDSVNITLFKPSGTESFTIPLNSNYNWNGKYKASVAEATILSGNYTFYLNATDVFGNFNVSQNYSFQVLSNNPKIDVGNILSPLLYVNASNTTSNITIPFTMSLSDSRIINNISIVISNQTTKIPIGFTNNYVSSYGLPVTSYYSSRLEFNHTNIIFGKEYNATVFITDTYGNVANKSIGKFKLIFAARNVTTNVLSFNESNETTVNAINGTNATLQIRTKQNITNVSVSMALYDINPGVSNFNLPSLGKYYEIEASDDLHTNLLWTIIRVYYTDQELVNKSIPEGSLMIYYNHPNGTWIPYNNQSSDYQGGVSTEGNYVWANTTHFSVYGVFQAQQSSGGSSGVSPGGTSGGSSGGSSSGGSVSSPVTESKSNASNEVKTKIDETSPKTVPESPTILNESEKEDEIIENSKPKVSTGFATLLANPQFSVALTIIILSIVSLIYLKFRK